MKELLEGTIGFMPLTHLLRWIEYQRTSCAVNVIQGETGISLYLEEGKLFFASSDSQGLRLGEFLVSMDLLTQSEMDQALADSRKEGDYLSRHLMEKGILPAEELRQAFQLLMDTIVREALRSDSGCFSVTVPIPDSVLEGPLRLQRGEKIDDTMRRFEEEERQKQMRRAAVARISDRVDKGGFTLPVLPDMITRLLAVIENDNSTFNDLVRIVMTDQVLVSRILQVANSPLFAAGEKIDSVHLAIARMGMRSIMNIATAFTLNSVVISGVPQDKLQAIFDDAVKTALMANGLARNCHVDPEQAFLCGLLKDLGKTVILSLAAEMDIDGEPLDEFIVERHAAIGAQIAGRWQYPESIQKVILHHHDPYQPGEHDRLLAVVQLADSIVTSHREKEPDHAVMSALGLRPEQVQEIHQQALDFFRQSVRH